MTVGAGIRWTNSSALALAGGADPVAAVQEAAQSLVLKAREAGWAGPPFNPLKIVEMLGAKTAANAVIADARLLVSPSGPVVEYNPQQPRERMRFSIAHEVAHMLFPDWRDEVRNRGGSTSADDWQLEMLCNIAASEFVMPIGSLPAGMESATIEDLMRERRRYDVSTEAFLIRFAKVTDTPVSVFFASPVDQINGPRSYRIDYSVTSPVAPWASVQGRLLPPESAACGCTAIGHTDSAVESWFSGSDAPHRIRRHSGLPRNPLPARGRHRPPSDWRLRQEPDQVCAWRRDGVSWPGNEDHLPDGQRPGGQVGRWSGKAVRTSLSGGGGRLCGRDDLASGT